MFRSLAAAAALFALSAPATLAQQVTGGSLTLSHSAFTDDGDFAKTSLGGSVELGFSREFGLQADVGLNRLNAADETATNLVLHGIYHLSEDTSAGLFLGLDHIDGESQSFVGLEFGHQSGRTGFEGYLGRAEDSGVSGTMLGLSTRYAVTEGAGIGLSVDRGEVEDVRLTRYSLNGDIAVAPNMTIFGEVGTLHGSVPGASDSEGYVKLGGKITFGAKRGTTFGQRSLLNVLPGL